MEKDETIYYIPYNRILKRYGFSVASVFVFCGIIFLDYYYFQNIYLLLWVKLLCWSGNF